MKNNCLLKLTLLLVVITVSGCAVMDKNIPGWTQYRSPDKTHELQLAFQSAGAGEPVLLIHGFGASSYSWRHVIEPLAQKNRVIAIDLTGVWYCMRHQIRQMLKQGGGAIVNCASTAGLRGAAFCGVYSAAKHGVVGLTKAAGLEYASQGVRINAVCPGMIRTPMTQSGPMKAVIDDMVLSTPLGRLGEPEEIGAAVLWLCGDDATFVHGQAIAVDGALTSR